MTATSRIIYSPHYNMGLMGLENAHPFDVAKFRRAWEVLQARLGPALQERWIPVDREATREDFLMVHTASYLEELKSSRYLARAFEQPWAALIPASLIDRGILQPMRWATRGTILAAEAALSHGLAINLGGGFHHAKPARGEGFCIYSDIAAAISNLRNLAALEPEQHVVYVDLDAHQGNGVCHQYLQDRRVQIYDQFNGDIYPGTDTVSLDRIDQRVQLEIGCTGDHYLAELKRQLPQFLDRVQARHSIGIAIYNAGTDIYQKDDLGMLDVSAEQILERDLFTVEQLHSRQIPTVFVTSGGYTQSSYQLIADSVTELLLRW